MYPKIMKNLGFRSTPKDHPLAHSTTLGYLNLTVPVLEELDLIFFDGPQHFHGSGELLAVIRTTKSARTAIPFIIHTTLLGITLTPTPTEDPLREISTILSILRRINPTTTALDAVVFWSELDEQGYHVHTKPVDFNPHPLFKRISLHADPALLLARIDLNLGWPPNSLEASLNQLSFQHLAQNPTHDNLKELLDAISPPIDLHSGGN